MSVVFATLIVLAIEISAIYNNIDEMNRNIIIDKTKRLYEKAKKRYKEEKTYRVISSNDDTKLDGLYDCLQ